MSTASQVATAFSAVFNNSNLTAITTKAYGYDITQQSERELSDLYYRNEVNFFTYLVTRSQEFAMTGKAQYKFSIECNYYREKNEDGTNYQAVRDAFDTLFSAIRSDLGTTLTSTVDFWRTQEGPAEVTTENVGGVDCFKGSYLITGFQLVTLT